MTVSKPKALFVYSDRMCSCTHKRTFEIVNGLWRYHRQEIDATAVYVDNLNEQHIRESQIVLFQRLGANGTLITNEIKDNLQHWIAENKNSCQFVYDIDDFLFTSQEGYPLTLAKQCHYALVPNAFLFEEMSKHQKNCHLIKTHVDLDAIEQAPIQELIPEDKMHFGWFSCSANGIDTIKEALSHLDGSIKEQIIIHLFCDTVFHDLVKKEIHGPYLKANPLVSPAEMYQYMRAMHSLLNPLTMHSQHEESLGVQQENLQNLLRGKSEIKYALAGACALPLIVTPIDSYKEVIKDGINGLFARDPKDWAEQIAFLVTNRTKASAIGQNAYEDVKKNYSLQRSSQDYLAFFKKLILQ